VIQCSSSGNLGQVSITAHESHLRGIVVDEAQRLGLVTGPGFRDLETKARLTEIRGGFCFESAGGMRKILRGADC